MKPLADWTEQELRDYGVGAFDPYELQESQIQWLPDPPFRLEEIDLLGLTPDEIVRVAFLMQTALRDARQLIHIAVEQIAIAHRKLNQRKTTMAGNLLPKASGPQSPTESKEAGADGPDVIRERAVNY